MTAKDCFDICVKKTENNIKKMKLGLREYPSCKDGYYFDARPDNTKDFMHIMNWTASFFTGMAILSYRAGRNIEMLRWLNSQYPLYYSKVFDTSDENMHDMGFLYSLYSVPMYAMSGDLNQKKLILKAADELAKRFVMNGRYIRAWGRMDDKISDYVSEADRRGHFFTQSKGLAIIDCMMNLPLLFKASEISGNSFYKSIAEAHADTVIRHFIRADGSVYHAYRFDPETGAPLGGCNYCGYSDESYWARGTTWAIYGFAIAYRYTGKQEYLDTALRLANGFIDNLPDDNIPFWDFRLPEGEEKNKDTSAAAIAVCGFKEILRNSRSPKIAEYAEKILSTLMTDRYTDTDIERPGILKDQNGSRSYTPYGDYFYMEALSKETGMDDICW